MINNNKKIISRKFMGLFLAICTVVLLVFSMSAPTLGIDDRGSTTEGMVNGIVTDAETNEPIANAIMTLEYHDIVRTEFTDSKGQYTFTNVPICFCLKNVSAAKAGYESEFQLVAISEISYLNFSLDLIKEHDESDEPDEPDEPNEPDKPDQPDEPNEPGDPNEPDDPDEPHEPEEPPVPPSVNKSMYGVLTGEVTNAVTGKPLSDVIMTLIYHDTVRTELTASNGEYTFKDIPICFCLKNISASKSGYASQYQIVAVSEMTNANFSLSTSDAGQIDQQEDLPESRDDSEPEPDAIRSKNNRKESSIGLESFVLAISVLMSTFFVVIIIGIFVYTSKKK